MSASLLRHHLDNIRVVLLCRLGHGTRVDFLARLAEGLAELWKQVGSVRFNPDTRFNAFVLVKDLGLVLRGNGRISKVRTIQSVSLDAFDSFAVLDPGIYFNGAACCLQVLCCDSFGHLGCRGSQNVDSMFLLATLIAVPILVVFSCEVTRGRFDYV